MRGRSRTADEIIAGIAAKAHGIVTRAELREAGIPAGQIDRRVAKGSLIPEYPGIYRVGHAAPSVLARYTAAVKACGPGALLCGLAAAYLHGLLKGKPPSPEVLTPTERKPKGLKTKRTRNPDPRDATERRAIPVTTVPVTLVHLAARLDDDEALARACHEAGVKYKTTPNHVKAVLQRMPNAKGAATLKAIMSGDVKVLLSKLEKRFIQRLIEKDLPIPDTNEIVDGKRVDCRWQEPGVTVELNGFRFHNSRHSWEQDQDREREAYARGDQFRRYTYKDVFEDPSRMFAELVHLLT